MSEVEVNSESISKLIKLCIASQSELEKTTTNLQKQYKELGSTWKDKKYKDFGDIIDKCCNVLKQPLIELKQCETFLQQLFRIISEYDKIHFSNSRSNGDTSSSILGDAILYTLNSCSSEVREWRSQINDISNRVQSFNRENFGSYISERNLNRPLSATVRYETRESFTARGEDSDVLGYNDGHRSRIVVGTGHELQTTVHENLHQLSYNNGRMGVITTDSNGNERNRQVNEAITELLTQRTLGSDYGADYSAYSNNRDAMAVLGNAMGNDMIYQAYFQNQPEILEHEVDRTLGFGHWVALSDAFESSLSGTSYEREMGRANRDYIINRYIMAVNNRNGGGSSWRDLIV
ncbi:MAG: hypothetical protein IJQ07_06685 [Clostridia bacterium]|nr:hypothetical protein [Clostridia bacterium]